MGHPTMQENDTAKLTPTFFIQMQLLSDKNKVNINTLFMISLFCCKIRMKEIVISLTYVKRFKPTQRFRLNTKIRCNMIL